MRTRRATFACKQLVWLVWLLATACSIPIAPLEPADTAPPISTPAVAFATPPVVTTAPDTASPTRTADQPPTLALLEPTAEALFASGAPIAVAGTAVGVRGGQTVQVSLLLPDGTTMSAVRLVAAEGGWRALLLSAAGYRGQVTVVASLSDESGALLAQAQAPIWLGEQTTASVPTPTAPAEAAPPPTPTPAPTATAPVGNIAITFVSSPVMAGQTLLLRGTARSAAERFDVVLGVYINDCSQTPGLIRFRMSSGGNWYALLTVPEYAPGLLCVRASIGEPSADNPDTAEVRLNALERGSTMDVGVALANPLPGAVVTAPFTADGVAVNAPNGLVTVTARAADGALLWEGTAAVDAAGYWRLQIPLADGTYGVTLTADVGEAGGQATNTVRVVPRPTPAPTAEPSATPEPTPAG